MMPLKDEYQRDDFLKFLEEDFLTDFKKDIKPVNTGGLASIQKAHYLGESKSLDLQVFEFLFEGSPNKRIALTKDAFTVMRSSAIFKALAVFHSPNSKDWRFSLMTATPEPTEKGKVSLSYSNPKRLSFFLGPNARVNTPTKYLLNKGKITDFNDLKNRFSIEVVNKEFYKEISQAFTKLVDGLLKLPSSQDKSRTNLEFAVRLIGRIIFCWFLREKKSSSGLALMPQEILSLEAVKKNDDYYHKILEPIFFEILNKPIKSRRDDFAQESFSSVPYLNGGLFSPQDDDYYKRTNDDYQSQYHNTLVIPDDWFKSFFEILETYNFTIDENTSYDEELSIDPEMLGRIFENLLAEINPETGESARKSTGSYYTPRIIVNYMVDESLSLYLKEKTGIKEEKLRAIISYDLDDDLENPVTEEEKEKIVDALEKVKILDPACGSGAFPMGALQKIVFILQQTDPDGQLWFKKQIKNTSPEIRRVVQREFEHKNFDYIRKLGIIRENIYGVDIQPIATEISRLRCFLTLVVDERVQDNADNRGIEPLPNLDFKFVTANSLMGLPKIDQPQQSLLDDYKGIGELKAVRDQYFTASGIEREQLKTEFSEKQKELVNELIANHDFAGYEKAELTRKLTSWGPFKHATTDWFDPEWMFGINEGFDIVFGNPPYVNTEKIKELEKSLYKKEYLNVHASRIDIYCYFYYRGLKFTKDTTGTLFYISSNKWMRAGYGNKIRSFISSRNPLQLIDFSGSKIFESATVDTCLLLVQNTTNKNSLEAVRFRTDFKQELNIYDYFSSNKIKVNFNSEETWYIGTAKEHWLKKKIEKAGITLDKWDINIQRGIITGLNEAFIINDATRQKLIAEDPNSEEIIKPLLRGRDIARYGYRLKGLYVLALGFGSYKIISQKYPAIYSYLLKYKTKLMNRGQCKSSRSGKRMSLDYDGQHHWLELDNNLGQNYFDELNKEKIAWIDLADDGRFTKVEKNVYIDKTLFFLTGNDIIYLLGALNSSLINWYLDTICNSSGVGTNLWSKISVEKFPIPLRSEVNKNIVLEICKTVNEIEKNKGQNLNSDTIYLEKNINKLVYKLYGLTEDEIGIVEGKNE